MAMTRNSQEISEFFGRTIRNAILLFSCSSHHDSLRSSRNFEHVSIIKNFLSSELSFFALYIKTITQIFFDYGPIKLQIIGDQQIMKNLSQTYSKF